MAAERRVHLEMLGAESHGASRCWDVPREVRHADIYEQSLAQALADQVRDGRRHISGDANEQSVATHRKGVKNVRMTNR